MVLRNQPGVYHRRLRQRAAERGMGQHVGERPTLAIPDLLYLEPFLAIDRDALLDLLGLGFLGKDLGAALDEALANAATGQGGWNEAFYADDLFVRDFARSCSQIDIDGATYPANRAFLAKVLTQVPTDIETVQMRQGILHELESDSTMRERFHTTYRALYSLLALFETPGYQGSIDASAIHLEILSQSKAIIDHMAKQFADATSALRRLHESGVAMQESDAYRILADLLEYESGMAELDLRVRVGGDGRIRRLRVEHLEENNGNQFHRPPWQRLRERFRMLAGGYEFNNKELMKRLVNEVFEQLSPALIPLVQLLGHLEFYLCSLEFKRQAERRGLQVCLADFEAGSVLRIDKLFNPLLLAQQTAPVPSRIENLQPQAITILTGPNSGGKTRVLQAIGWAQLLGQSGIYLPARSANLPLASGLFVSLVENESADQTEGRLGRELVRIRSLFEEIRPASMVVLDELCSGTNPSEGVEVFALVLKLLHKVHPTAFVTTHFLDFARAMQSEPPISPLEFLQVELDEEQLSTYQFIRGVAPTSLAALTASRLGVTFERLSALLEAVGGDADPAEDVGSAANADSSEYQLDEAPQ